MKTLDRTILNKWLNSMSSNEAMKCLMDKTDLGVSTLQKVLAGTYPSQLKQPIRKAFAEAVGVPEDKLWRDK